MLRSLCRRKTKFQRALRVIIMIAEMGPYVSQSKDGSVVRMHFYLNIIHIYGLTIRHTNHHRMRNIRYQL